MSSSDTDRTITTEDFDKLNEIINYLKSIDQEKNFIEPVDWEKFQIPDYPVIIRNPMDLSTLQNNLKERKYQLVSEVLDDIQLIWDNCKTYNREDSEIHKQAIEMEKATEKYVKKFYKNVKRKRDIENEEAYNEPKEFNPKDNSISIKDRLDSMNLVRFLDEKQHKLLIERLRKEISEVIFENDKLLKIDFSKLPRAKLDLFKKIIEDISNE